MNVPEGADYDPRAPWNETENPELPVELEIVESVTRNVVILTDNYILESSKENEDGGVDYVPDFSNTDFKYEYLNKCDNLETALQNVIKLLVKLSIKATPVQKIQIQKAIESISGWTQENIDVYGKNC